MSCRRTALLVVGSLFVTSACVTVGPDYQAPQVTSPDQWYTAATEGVAAGEAELQTWWTVFEDSALDGLLDRAQNGNLSLEAALWRVEEAMALRGVAAGSLMPTVSADGSSSRQQLSDNGPNPPPVGGWEAFDLHDYSVGASWEIDLFGGLRRAVEAADAGVEASAEYYRDVLVSVLSEVAVAYLDVRSLQERLNLAGLNVRSQEETLQLTGDRFEAGLVSGLDVAQAESNLASTRALIPGLQAALESSMFRLSVLLGEQPGALSQELADGRGVPMEPSVVIVNLPAELLRQRPDVRRAERNVAAQTARIGVATAELYPKFSLTGAIGLQALEAGDLASGDSLSWGIALPIRWNLFAGGRIRAQIRVEEARTEQAITAYEQVVLKAMEEAERAMVSYERERERRKRLRVTVEATERALGLVLTQYRSGIADFQNVLDTQRSLLLRQDELAASEGQVAKNLVALYRALGGGWDPDAPLPPLPHSRIGGRAKAPSEKGENRDG